MLLATEPEICACERNNRLFVAVWQAVPRRYLYDGLRQYTNPTNYSLAGVGPFSFPTGGGTRGFVNTGKLDYANDATGYANKITYLTPVWSGFQAGASYTPSVSNNTGTLPIGGVPSGAIEGSHAFGVHQKNAVDDYGEAWEGALRYEGKWQELGLTAGGGYTHVSLENDSGAGDCGAGAGSGRQT